jgi:hypothetical protein
MMALLLGDRSKLVYIKLPNAAEKNIGAIPAAGKGCSVMTAYGIIRENPNGNIRIDIARSWR